jgi:hypothetical protein
VQFGEICGYIKSYENQFFSPLSFVAVFGSGIRDPGSGWVKISPGSGINIPDPQHCFLLFKFKKIMYDLQKV